MTLTEFRLWLAGFSEAVGDAPTAEQWARVKEQLAQVPAPVPAVVPPLDRTAPWQQPWRPPVPVTSGAPVNPCVRSVTPMPHRTCIMTN